MGLDFLAFGKLFAIALVPIMVSVVWMLPKLLTSKPQIKMQVGAIIVSVFMLFLLGVKDYIGNLRPGAIIIIAALIWGIIGFHIGVYFDIRLRVESGKIGESAYGMIFAVVGSAISIPSGIVTGWIHSSLGISFWGIFLDVFVGSIYGGFLGWILSRVRVHEN